MDLKRFLLFLVPVVLFMQAGVPDDAIGSEWKGLYPSPTPNEIFDSYTPDGKIVYMAGSGGTILKYDGSELTIMDTPTKLPLYGIHGTGTANIWAVGGDNAADSPEEKGVVLHYDGTKWTKISAPVPSGASAGYSLSDVYVVSATSVWVVMKNRYSVFQWNGSTWETYNPLDSIPFSGGFNKVSGASSSAIWFAGDTNKMAFWNGNEFTDISRDTSLGYYDITSCWAADENTLFTGGHMGALAKWDSEGNYQEIDYDFDDIKGVSGVVGTSSDDVYFLGYSGFFVHYDGNRGTWLTEGDTWRRNTMSRTSNGDWIVGTEQGVQVYSNGKLNDLSVPAVFKRNFYEKALWHNGLWLFSSYISSTSPIELLRQHRKISIYPPENKTWQLNSAGFIGNDDLLVGVMDYSDYSNYIYRYSSGVWSEWIPPGYSTNRVNLNDALLTPGGKLFVLAGYGTSAGACLIEGDSKTCHLSNAVFNSLAAGGETVYAVGDEGAIAVYRDGAWSSEDSGTTKNLIGVACSVNEVYAIGDDRTAIWKTNSASASWQAVSNLTEKEYYEFTDLVYGTNMGFAASLKASQTGGSQWISFLYSFDSGRATMDEGWMGPNVAVNALAANGDTGFAAGHPGVLMYTGLLPDFIPDLTKERLYYLDDAIILLRVIAGLNPDEDLSDYFKILNNERIGLSEAIHILKNVSE